MGEAVSEARAKLSRTETLLESIEACLAARAEIARIKLKHANQCLPDFGERTLKSELAEIDEVYITRLDRLRAVLGNAGIQV